MVWQLRALIEDRPGALAALAQRCADHHVNILALDLLPTADGMVVDELLVSAPESWTAADLGSLCRDAGLKRFAVTPSSVRDLEDVPVRYLRAAGAVVEDPSRLASVLCAILDAEVASASTSGDVLDCGALRLTRSTPFTDTERARANELGRVAAAVDARGSGAALSIKPGAEVTIRLAVPSDAGAVAHMHERCSAESLRFRYHAATTRLSDRRLSRLLEPPRGLCLVATAAHGGGEVVVATGVAVRDASTADVGLLVEDQLQRTGVGTRLLHAIAAAARTSGVSELVLECQPDNRAVPSLIHRAGFRAHATFQDGCCRYRLQLGSPSQVLGEPEVEAEVDAVLRRASAQQEIA